MCPDSCDLDSRPVDNELASEQDNCGFSSNTTKQSSDDSNAATSKSEISKFVIRLPSELLENLKRVSRHHNRSMNAEINLLLGRYIEQVKGESRPGIDEHIKLDSLLLQKLSALPAQKIDALLDLLD